MCSSDRDPSYLRRMRNFRVLGATALGVNILVLVATYSAGTPRWSQLIPITGCAAVWALIEWKHKRLRQAEAEFRELVERIESHGTGQ